MLTGERRGLSARRGMTVLGRIPAVPKPINLPSQRLENRGLDPNVDLVPRGTVSWGSSGRSPSTGGSAWGIAQSSLLFANTGAWGVSGEKVTLASGSNNFAGSLSAASSQPTPANGARPSSAGSSTKSRIQSAGSNAWGLSSSLPSSVSSGLGQGVQLQPTITRPRSAEMRSGGPHLSRFADSINEPLNAPSAWGVSGISLKSEEQLKSSHFTLTPVDFPTLGSEKNHDIRPQEGFSTEHLGTYGSEARGVPDVWCKENPLIAGPSSRDGNWHRIDASSHAGGSASHESCHIEDSSRDDSWHPATSHVGAYGPVQFHSDPHRAMPLKKRGPGHGDIYGISVQQSGITSGGPGTSFSIGMRPGGMQCEAYYGVAGSGPTQIVRHRNMNEEDMTMLGMGGPVPGMHINISQNSGPPNEHFDRHRYHVHGARSHDLAIQSRRPYSHEGETCSEISYGDSERRQDAQGRLKEDGDFSGGSFKHCPCKDATGTSVDRQNIGHHEQESTVSNRTESMDFPKTAVEDISSALVVLKALDTSEVLPEKKSARIKILNHSLASHVAYKPEMSLEEKCKHEGKIVNQLMSKKALGEHHSIKDIITQNKDEISDQSAGRDNWREDLKAKHEATKSNLLLCNERNDEKQDNIACSVSSSIISKAAQQTPLRTHIPSSTGSVSVEENSNLLFQSGSDTRMDMLDTDATPAKITRILQPVGKPSSQHFQSELSSDNDSVEHLKHNEETCPDSLQTGLEHLAHTKLVKGSNMIRDSISKDERKMKSHFNIHEGEKEWRPKSLITQLKTEISKSSVAHIGGPAAVMLNTTVVENISNKGDLKNDFEKRVVLDDVHQMENLQVTDTYDYESQNSYGSGTEPLACGKPKDTGENLSSGDTLMDLRKGMEETQMKTSDNISSGDYVNVSPVLKFDFVVPDLSQEIAFGSVKNAIDFPNVDIPNEKVAVKSQPVHSSFKERRSRDPRMKEKSLANEGLVWTVKSLSPRNATGFETAINMVEGSSESHQGNKNVSNESSSPSSHRSRRADLQRYNPKLASKSYGQVTKVRGQNASNIYQLPNQRHEDSFQGDSDPEVSSLTQSNMTKPLSATDNKHESESFPSETARAVLIHTSWKQRNQIENTGTKILAEHGELQLSQPGHIDTSKQGHVNVLDGNVDKTKHRIIHKSKIDQQATEESFSQDFSTCGQSVHDIIPGIEVVSSLQPSTAKQNRQQDCQRRSILIDSSTLTYNDDISEKERGSGRRDSNCRSWSASSHLHSIEEHILEEDSINSGTTKQGLQKPLIGPPETASSEKEQKEATGAASYQLQGKGSTPKEQALTESSKKGHRISSWRQGKYYPALSNKANLCESGSNLQQHDKSFQINKQLRLSNLQKEFQTERGNTLASLQKKQDLGHLQWQQTSTGVADKSQIIEESEDVMTSYAYLGDYDCLRSSSLSKQRVPVLLLDHSSLNDSRKIQRSYGQFQKQSKSHYLTESQSVQRTKQKEHLLPLPATDDFQTHSTQTHCNFDCGNGFYFRPKNHKPLRGGHYRLSDGKGSNGMDGRKQLHGQGITIDVTVDPA